VSYAAGDHFGRYRDAPHVSQQTLLRDVGSPALPLPRLQAKDAVGSFGKQIFNDRMLCPADTKCNRGFYIRLLRILNLKSRI
jgi:hypothetical protein